MTSKPRSASLLDAVTPGSGGPPPAGGTPMRLALPAIYFDALKEDVIWRPLGLEGSSLSERARRLVELWDGRPGGAWPVRADVPPAAAGGADTGARPVRMVRVSAWFSDRARDVLEAACKTLSPAPVGKADAFRQILGGYLSLTSRQAAAIPRS